MNTIAPITTATPRSGVLRQDHERLILQAAEMLDSKKPLQTVVDTLQKEGVRGDERFLLIKGAEVLRGHRRRKILWQRPG